VVLAAPNWSEGSGVVQPTANDSGQMPD